MSVKPKGRKSPPYSLHLCNGIVTITDPRRANADDVPEQEACLRILTQPALLAACKAALYAISGEEYDPTAFDRAEEVCKTAIAKAGG
jgi:hypothetical protein